MSKTRSSAAQAVFDANVQKLSHKFFFLLNFLLTQPVRCHDFLMPNKSTWWKKDPQKVA